MKLGLSLLCLLLLLTGAQRPVKSFCSVIDHCERTSAHDQSDNFGDDLPEFEKFFTAISILIPLQVKCFSPIIRLATFTHQYFPQFLVPPDDL